MTTELKLEPVPEVPADADKPAAIRFLEQELDTREELAAELKATLKACAVQRREIGKKLRELRMDGKRKRRRRTADTLDPHAQAGPKNLHRVRSALTSLGGTGTQAAIAKRSGVGSGTMTYAIRALESDGIIEPTGNVGPRGTREFRFVARAGRRKMAAGD